MIANSERRLILLGPQAEFRSLQTALERLDIDGPVALITAGFEEDERQDEAIRNAVPHAIVNLELFHRSEELFREDAEMIQLLQERQDKLRYARDVYRRRLDFGLTAARETMDDTDGAVDLDTERESSIDFVRQLDNEYFARTRSICRNYEEQLQTPQRPQVVRHRNEIQDQLGEVKAIVISGGHAAIILNRLRIFGPLEMLPDLPVIAWSGGAMAISQQIVLFHDSPPQGHGNAELLRSGMGLFGGILPLPDARRRLILDDHTRVGLFARRFQSFACVVFDDQTLLDRDQGSWQVVGGADQLHTDGTLISCEL